MRVAWPRLKPDFNMKAIMHRLKVRLPTEEIKVPK
jgi:hypothetical protein